MGKRRLCDGCGDSWLNITTHVCRGTEASAVKRRRARVSAPTSEEVNAESPKPPTPGAFLEMEEEEVH